MLHNLYCQHIVHGSTGHSRSKNFSHDGSGQHGKGEVAEPTPRSLCNGVISVAAIPPAVHELRGASPVTFEDRCSNFERGSDPDDISEGYGVIVLYSDTLKLSLLFSVLHDLQL